MGKATGQPAHRADSRLSNLVLEGGKSQRYNDAKNTSGVTRVSRDAKAGSFDTLKPGLKGKK